MSIGVETTRHFLLEWLSYTFRYVPVGLLDVIPQRLNWRPPSYFGRDDLETLMASDSAADWVCIKSFYLWPYTIHWLLLLSSISFHCVCRFGSLRCCLARCQLVLVLHQNINQMHMIVQKMVDTGCGILHSLTGWWFIIASCLYCLGDKTFTSPWLKNLGWLVLEIGSVALQTILIKVSRWDLQPMPMF